jgi:hypothetical protein
MSSRYKDRWASEIFWRQDRRKVLWFSEVETWPSSFQPLTDLITIKYMAVFVLVVRRSLAIARYIDRQP